MHSCGAGETEIGEATTVEEIALISLIGSRSRMARALESFEADDEMMEVPPEPNQPTEELHAAIRRATLANTVNPTLTFSAQLRTGRQPMLDTGVVRYPPSPLDIEEAIGV